MTLMLLKSVTSFGSEEKLDDDFFIYSCSSVPLDNNHQVIDFVEKDKSPKNSNAENNTNVFADDIKKLKNGNVSFVGNVQVEQGDVNLSADSAQINESNNSFNARGNIRYQDKQIKLTTEEISINFTEKSGKVTTTEFQLIQGGLRGKAEAISLSSDKPQVISNAGITSCPPDNKSWLLESSVIIVDPSTGWGEAENVVLRIHDIPVFYFPMFSFPLDDRRKSGFLFPSFGSSDRNGLEIGVPWYWNIAPDKDATFSARYMGKRGLLLGTEYRQLTESTQSKIIAEYLANDLLSLNEAEDRYFYQLTTDYSSGDNWRGNLDYSSVSDDNYFYDFGSDFDSGNRNFLRRIGQIRFNSENLSFTGTMSDDQLLSAIENSYSRLPQLQMSLLYPNVVSGLSTKVHMEATAFRHDNLVEADRFMIAPEISMPMHWLSGYIKPKLTVHHSEYSQEDPNNLLTMDISRTVPIVSVDSGMFFDRNFKYDQAEFLQTLEPRLFYLYVPEKEQSGIALFDTTSVNNGVDSLFRENRYSGFDRIGDSNQVSLAVTSRFFEQASGLQRMSLTVGRAYYLEDRHVNLAIYPNGSSIKELGVDNKANSAIITNLELSLYDQWWLQGELEYDESQSRTEKGVLGLHYRSDNVVLNLRHRINRFDGTDDIEQAEISMSWPMTKDWSFVGRWQQDIRNNRTIDGFAGLEYEGCCWAVRLVARRYLNIKLDQYGAPISSNEEFNNGIYLEFILKGLTNVGKSLNLEQNISGYNDRFSH